MMVTLKAPRKRALFLVTAPLEFRTTNGARHCEDGLYFTSHCQSVFKAIQLCFCHRSLGQITTDTFLWNRYFCTKHKVDSIDRLVPIQLQVLQKMRAILWTWPTCLQQSTICIPMNRYSNSVKQYLRCYVVLMQETSVNKVCVPKLSLTRIIRMFTMQTGARHLSVCCAAHHRFWLCHQPRKTSKLLLYFTTCTFGGDFYIKLYKMQLSTRPTLRINIRNTLLNKFGCQSRPLNLKVCLHLRNSFYWLGDQRSRVSPFNWESFWAALTENTTVNKQLIEKQKKLLQDRLLPAAAAPELILYKTCSRRDI